MADTSWDAFDPAPTPVAPAPYFPAGDSRNNPAAVAVTPQPDWEAFDPTPAPGNTPPAPPPAASTHAVAPPKGQGYSPYSVPNAEDAYNFLRTAATNATAGIAGTLFGLPDPITQMMQPGGPKDPGTEVTKATGHIADSIYGAPVIGGPEYQPQTKVGQYGMDAATFAAPALLEGPAGLVPNLARGAAAGLAAHAAGANGLPEWAGPAATALTEFLARKGLGLFNPHSSTGAALSGGKVMQEITDGSPLPPVVPPPAIPGMQLTVGQRADHPGFLALDRDLNNDAQAQSQTAADLGTNQAVIRDHLGTIASGPGGADAAVAQTGNVKAARTASQAGADAKWRALPPDVRVNMAPLKTALDDHITGVTAHGDDDLLPNAQIQRLQSLPDNAPLSALQARRSRLVTDAADAGRAGNTNSARVIKSVADLVGNHIDDENNIVTGTPDDLAAYRAARAATKAHYDTFGDDHKAGAQVSDLTAGKVAPESALARFLPPGAEGTGAQSLSRLKLASGTGKGLNPARDYLVGKLKEAVSGGADAFGKVLDNYSYAFKDKDLFTPEQQATISDAREAVAQTYRKAPAGADIGSPTYQQLKGNNFARVLYGNVLGRVVPRVAKTLGSIAGGALAAHAPIVGSVGADITGNLFGGEAASEAHGNAMVNARSAIIDVIDRARKDPMLAKQLQMKATKGNLKMAPRLGQMPSSLGLSETLALPNAPSP